MAEENEKNLRSILRELVVAKTSLIYLWTDEDRRVETEVRALAQAFKPPLKSYVWSCTTGVTLDGEIVTPNPSIMSALDWFVGINETAFLIINDIHVFLKDNPPVMRKLKDTLRYIENGYKTVFMTSPFMDIPTEMANDVVLVDVPLPKSDEIERLIQLVISKEKHGQNLLQAFTPQVMDQFLKISSGLTSQQVMQAFRKVFAGKSAVTENEIGALYEEKTQIVRKSGILELVPRDIKFDDLGGFGNMKKWLDQRKDLFSSRAREYGLTMPKGVLMMGISGCGKSLCVKALADFWKLPLLRLDMGRMYDGIMGAPEECFRKAIKTAEASSPCVLWIDEIEAGLANAGQKAMGGSASRVLAHFLTWMQEKTAPVFVGATANEIELLPPEILRKGRFDELFYVELPQDREREEIMRIHLGRRNVNGSQFEFGPLVKVTEGFNGAELEQGVIAAIFRAFTENREVTQNDLYIGLENIVPLSTTMQEQIKKLERWAHNRALKAGVG